MTFGYMLSRPVGCKGMSKLMLSLVKKRIDSNFPMETCSPWMDLTRPMTSQNVPMYQENLKEINLEPRWTTKVTTKRWQLAIVGSDTCSNYSLCGEINVSETLETILATCLSIWWRVEESAFPMWTKKQLSRPQHKFCAFASPFFCSSIGSVCRSIFGPWPQPCRCEGWKLHDTNNSAAGTLGEFVRISARPQPNMVQQSHQIMIYLIRH